MAAIFAMLVAGCSSPGAPDDGPDNPFDPLGDGYEEIRGEVLPIGNIDINSNIRWRAAAEIVFATTSDVPRITDIRALRISDFTSKALHTGGNVNYSGYRWVDVSSDGSQVYFTLSKPIAADFDLFHVVPGAAPVLIAINPRSVALPTPDSRGAAYGVAPDSIRMYNVATRSSRRVGEGCSVPLVFSPDGARLLCRTGNSYRMMRVSDGSTEPVTFPGTVSSQSFFWGAGGLKGLNTPLSGDHLSVIDVATGMSTTLVTQNQFRTFEFAYFNNVTWSHDGRKVAFSTSRGLLAPPTEEVLYVVDIETVQTKRAAVFRFAGSAIPKQIGWIAFSPDGGKIEYTVGNYSSAQSQVYLGLTP